MPSRDSAATRARVLDAAIDEFARHGHAGARVDRIAAAARANKRAIYDYFGDKDALFAAAVTAIADRLIAEVPVTPDDLPGYAGRLFDYHVAHPEAMRLETWRNLERPGVAPGTDLTPYRSFVEAVRSRPGAGALPALDLAVLFLSMAAAWPLANSELLAVEGGDPQRPERLERHRASLVDAVARLTG